MVAKSYSSHRIYEVIYEDVASVPLPSTPRSDRAERQPLSVKPTGENGQTSALLSIKPKQKKTTTTTTISKSKLRDQKLLGPEILEDEYKSSSSSAVEEARQELIALYKENNLVTAYLDIRPQTPPSKAVRAARRRLTRTPPLSSSPESLNSQSPGAKRLSPQDFLVISILNSPFDEMNASAEEVMEDTIAAEYSPAASISPITSPSSRPSPRIEDSVEAIDSLAEKLEELTTALPVVVDDVKTVSFKAASASPQPKAIANTTKKRVASAPVRQKPAAIPQQSAEDVKKSDVIVNGGVKSAPRPSMTAAAKPTERKTSTTTTARLAERRISTNTAIGVAGRRTSMPASKTPMTPAAAPRLAPRVASITKTPFVPVKSTKTPTRAAFTLPGDAITARKKAQLEARLKREEEERIARRQFKARPVPTRNSIGAVDLQRLSQRSSNATPNGQVKNRAPAFSQTKAVKKPVTRPLANTTTKQSLQTSTTITKPTSRPARQPMPRATKPATTPASKANSTNPARSVRPTPRPAITKNVAKPVPSSAGSTPRSTVAKSVTKPASSPASGSATPTKLMTPQEKMAAAKKARSEAAERGRQASREWAEKKRAALTAQTTKQT